MKKLLSTLCLIAAFVFCTNSSLLAQSKFQIGAGLGYGAEVESVGIQANGVYLFTDKIRGAADFLYYFPSQENLTYWEFNVNGHYLLLDNAKANVYALAGLNYFKLSAEVTAGGRTFSGSTSEIGLNLGGGAEYGVGFGSLFAELKYVIGGAEQLALVGGLRFGI